MTTILLALDGHDGSGKTTLAQRLAQRLDACYVRPFAGVTGERFLTAAEQGRSAEAWEIACRAVQETLEQHRDATAVVMDRCWMTVFTVIPEQWHAHWPYRIPTAVCWVDLETTLARLASRAETQEAVTWHAQYLRRYADLAEQHGCRIIRTDRLSEDAAFAELLTWAQQQADLWTVSNP